MKGIAGLYGVSGDIPRGLMESFAAAVGTGTTLQRPAPHVALVAGTGAESHAAEGRTAVCAGEVVAPPLAMSVPSAAQAVLAAASGDRSPAEALCGGFAYAVWDDPRQELELAVDRFRCSPLVYARLGTVLAFASDLRLLRRLPGFDGEIDPTALVEYLNLAVIPAPRTFFRGARKLRAAHHLRCRRGGEPVMEPYWRLRYRDDAGVPAATLAVRLREALAESVRRHAATTNGARVGAFLSGGLDSSLVVALMSRVAGRPIQTFTVGFQEASYDERAYAHRVARAAGTEHHEAVVRPDAEDVVHRLVEAFDEPFADSSAVAAWYVARMAAGHTKVVLSGDGGDEVFGGYVIYQADRLAGLYRRLPSAVGARLLPALVGRLPASERKMSWDLRAKRFVANAHRDPLAAHVGWRAIFSEEMKARLYAAPVARRDPVALLRAHFDAAPGPDLLNRFMVVDMKVSLVDDMLTKVDRTSMAHGLEVRVPLLDPELVTWASRLPSRTKVRGLGLKWLLRRVARDLLPAEIVDRPKAGFHVPVSAWLKGELRPLVDAQLGEATIRRQGLFDPAVVRGLVDDHMAGREDLSRNLWGLLMFGLWYDRYLGDGVQ